ncbi:MAG: MFS transporter [Thaumarchaeota archaeon]|nr:MFS transporter [Nitrososphaerota archaeon]
MRVGRSYSWVILSVAFAAIFISSGANRSIGLFFGPLQRDFGWDIATLSLAVALSTLVNGVSNPVVGKLTDRHGPRIVMFFSGISMGAGLVALFSLSALWQFYVMLALIGFGYTGLSNVTGTALVVHWFQRRKGTALSMFQAGFSAGQLFLIPLTGLLMLVSGWQSAFLALGLMVLALLPVIAVLVKDRPLESSSFVEGRISNPGDPTRVQLKAQGDKPFSFAAKTRPFWLITFGYFICGFTSISIATHFPVIAEHHGFSPTVAAANLGVMGGVNVLGTLFMGSASDKVGRKNLLALTYLIRGLTLVMLFFTLDGTLLTVFAAVFGFAYYATVPLTSGLCSDFYGRRHMGTIYGVVMLVHQIGGAVGTYLAGYVFSSTGTYASILLAMIASSALAALMSYGIGEGKWRTGSL